MTDHRGPARAASFASFLGIAKPAKASAKPKTKPAPGMKPAGKPQAPASVSAPFGHLLPTDAKPPRTPQQRAATRGAAARACVDAYAQATVTAPPGPQTAPAPASAEAERRLAEKIIAAGRKRRGEKA